MKWALPLGFCSAIFLAACSQNQIEVCNEAPSSAEVHAAFNQGLKLGSELSCGMESPEVKPARAEPQPKRNNLRYRTSCEIKNGRAVGFLHNLQKSTLRYRGEVHFDIFDPRGEFVRRATRYAVGSTPWDFNLEVQSVEIGPHESQCELIVNEALTTSNSDS